MAYVVMLGLSEFGASVALTAAHVPYRQPGLGFAAFSATPLLAGALFNVIFVAFFVQARRIADGPTAGELHEVFA